MKRRSPSEPVDGPIDNRIGEDDGSLTGAIPTQVLRSIEELKEILGHYSVAVTERYAHLRPDLFAAGAHNALNVDLTATGGDVVSMENGQSMTSKPESDLLTRLKYEENAGAAL